MMNYKKLFLFLISITTIIRMLVIGRIGLGDDEAHYFAYSRHLDLSYFDHPPAIGYIIKFFTLIFGSNEFAVRLPAVLCFVLISVFIFLLARRMFNERVAFWSVALLNVTPLFSFLGAVLTVPDAPLAVFWMVFIYVFWNTIQNNKKGNWYILGILLGLGLLSKYNAVLLVPSVFLFLLFSPRHRHWFGKKEPYIALLIASTIFLPVIVWNLENNWASFGFQLRHGFGHSAPKFSLQLLGRSLGAQAGYISPLLFFVYWAALLLLIRRLKDEKSLFIFAFSFPTLFLFNAISSFNEILPHWPAMGYLILSIAVAKFTADSWNSARFAFKSFTYLSWGIGIILCVLVPLQALYKIIPVEKVIPREEALKIEDGISKAEKIDITNDIYGWDIAGKRIAEIINQSPAGKKPFIFTHRHYIASQLKFYVPAHPPIFCLSERIDAYDFWQRDLSGLDGRDAIFVTDNRFYTDPSVIYPFESWQKPEQIEVNRKGKKVRIFWITRANGFKLAALDKAYTSSAAGERLSWQDGLRRFDRGLFLKINKNRHLPVLDYIMEFFSFAGNGVPLVLITGAILWFTRRDNFWPEFLLASGIILFGGIFVQVIKHIVGRARPPTIFGPDVHLLGQKLYFASFPSGHAQAAFGTATFLYLRIKKYAWVFFLFAALVAFSRIYVGVHFPVDVLAGSLIGIFFTFLALKFIKI